MRLIPGATGFASIAAKPRSDRRGGSKSRGSRALGGILASALALGSWPLAIGGTAALAGSLVNGVIRPVVARADSAGDYRDAVMADSPMGYWRLHDSAGSSAQDETGANPGTITGGVTTSQPGPFGGDTSMSFDGSTGFIDLGTGLLPLTAVTTEAWVNTAGSGQQAVLTKWAYNCNTDAYGQFVFGGSHAAAVGVSGSCQPGFSGGSVPANQWTHIVMTYDSAAGGSNLILYVDGAQVASATVSGGLSTTDPSVRVEIGKEDSTSVPRWFQGRIAEVALYDHALTAAKVQAHYDASGLIQQPAGGALTDPQSRGGGNPGLACTSSSQQSSAGHGKGADPVDTATGNFFETQIDFRLLGRGCPLGFARTYNSTSAATLGPLGYGWQPNVGMSLAVSGSTTTITQENGSQVTFVQSGASWVPSAPRFIATLSQNPDGTWTFVRQAKDTYIFTSAGRLTSTTDLNGYRRTYTYNASNQLTAITDDAGRSLNLSWSGTAPTDKVTEVDDANVSPVRRVQFQYNDGNGNLTDVLDVGGGHWQFAYDGGHRITVMKDPRCFSNSGCPGVQNHYDGSGRIDWQKDPLNRQTSFSYSGDPMTREGGATAVTDPSMNVTLDTYRWGLLTSRKLGSGTPEAGTTTYRYDVSSLGITSVSDPNRNLTALTYDANGNLLTLRDAVGNTTVNTYNALNQMLTTRDPLLVTTTTTYDARGNVAAVSRPLNGTSSVQTITYNHANAAFPGDVTSVVDPENKTWSYGYDANGYRTDVTDPLGDKSTTAYNADGWVTSAVTPKGNVPGCGCAATYTTAYGYDNYGNVTTVTDPGGHVSRRHYDLNQNLDYMQDGNQSSGTCTLGVAGPCTQYVYDLANEQASILRPDGTTLVTDHNPDGTVAAQKDALGVAIQTYGYDHQGRATRVTDALNNVTRYNLDAAGSVVSKEDPGGNCGGTPKVGCTTYGHDADLRLTSINYSDGVTANVSNIQYDADGQRTQMTDGTGSSSWVRDSLHRLSSYTNGAGSQVQYQYNLRNLVTSLAYPGGNCGSTPTLCVSRVYDDAGRWTSVTDWNAKSTTFEYDQNSNLTTERVSAGGVVDTFAFDATDTLTSIADNKGAASLFSASYGRDSANQVSSDSSAQPGAKSYRYSPLEQLCYAGSSSASTCDAPPAGSTPYQYDAGDNLVRIAGNTQTFNAAHELCWTTATTSSKSCASPPTGATTYAYDQRGNQTARVQPGGPSVLGGFDQANRLMSLSVQTGATVTPVAAYKYDGSGLRMSKTVAGTTSQFTWDLSGGLPLMIQEGAARYVYGPGGLPVEQVGSSATLWLHHDQLGSTRLVTSAAGVVVGTAIYDAYGSVTAATGTALPLGFAGEYRDSESGLIYLRARYYDPRTGQFLSKDPLVAATGKPYAYTGNNPLNATDPTGLFCVGGRCVDVGPEEIAACLSDPMRCAVALGDEQLALEEQDRLFRKTPALEGCRAAFRHAYWSALMTVNVGAPYADIMGTAHSADRSRIDSALHTERALNNNQRGRTIGALLVVGHLFIGGLPSPVEVEAAVLIALDHGYLDTRRDPFSQ
jgi:RHS repeat-associated protein